MRRGRNRWCAAAVVAIVLPALGALPAALAPAAAASMAVMAALAAFPLGRVDFRTAAVVSCVSSLLADVGYLGPQNLALLWMPVELGALCVVLGRAVRTLPVSWLWPVGAGLTFTVVFLPARLVLYGPPNGQREVGAAAFVAATFLFPAVFAAAVGAYLRSSDSRRRLAVSTARRQERRFVADGLHDFVAHELTGIVLEAQAGQLGDLDRRQVGDLLHRIEVAGTRALESMDDTLRALRAHPDEPGDRPGAAGRMYGLADLPELVERFGERDGGPRTALYLPSELPPLGRDAGALAYALVVEALTNVRRHAPDAREVAVAVSRTGEGLIEIKVADTGGRPRLRQRAVRGGTGLVSLSERLAALGGELSAGPLDGGWVVVGRLPVECAVAG